MSRIFLSHSSENNAEAVALRDWLGSHGWDDLFLGLDPERGLKAGERWQAALKQAAERCELVIFLVSPECVRLAACLCLPDVAFLRRTGLSRSRLKRLVAEGLPLHGSKIDHAEALKWIEGAVDPARKDNWQGDATLNNLRRAREPPRPRRAARRPTTAWVIIGSQNKPRGDAKMPRGSVYHPQAPPYQCGHVHRGHQKMQL